jgi:hypothetical protein
VPTVRKKRAVLIAALSVVAVAAAIAAYLILKPKPPAPAKPLLTKEFAEAFVNLDRWEAPPSGWTFANQVLQVENQPIIGYPPAVNCKDFTMVFHLKLLNDGGAAWALRVKDPDNYYLFYLSGPGGMNPNSFLTYVVQNGKTLLKHSDSLVVHLVHEGEYQISIDVEDNRISHMIKTDKTKPEFEEEYGEWKKLGLFYDVDKTQSAGSIGFRTFGREKFAVWALYVRPPGVKLPE